MSSQIPTVDLSEISTPNKVLLKDDKEVNLVLEAYDCGKRKRKSSVTREYVSKKKKHATEILNKWLSTGVPLPIYQRMEYLHSPLIIKYRLRPNTISVAFNTPYDAAKYSTFVCSKIRETGGEYNVNAIKCKMFVTPLDVSLNVKEIPESFQPNNQKWFVTPIRHTN